MADSKKIDDGGLAFPGTRSEQVGYLSDYAPTDDDAPTFAEVHHPGMSLRDYFAGQALPSIVSLLERSTLTDFAALAKNRKMKTDDGVLGKLAANMSYEIADAMIAARKAGA